MKRIVPLLLPALILLSGCSAHSGSIFSGYRETENLLLVQTLGADSAEEGGVRLSVSCAKPSQNEKGSIICRSGSNILRAMNSLQSYCAPRQLYYSHAQYVVFGEDYAREGLDTALDFIARDTQLRLGLYLFAVKGGSAEELISGPAGDAYEISKTLEGIHRDTEKEGGSHVFTARETLRSLSEHGAALICALRSADTEGSVFLPEAGITALPEGYGILSGGKLVGFVEPELARAADILLGHTGTAGLSLPDGRGGSLSLEFESSSFSLKNDGGMLALDVSLKANLAEPDTDIVNVTDRELLGGLEKALAAEMEGQLTELLSLSRELEADFLGLGAYLPEKSENWLKNADFSVKCDAKISYARELGDSVNTDGGE